MDLQANLSAWSAAVEVKNPLDHPQPAPSRDETDRAACAERVRKVHAAGAGRVWKQAMDQVSFVLLDRP